MISYTISVHKEKEELKKLLDTLYNEKIDKEEVIIVQTYQNINEKQDSLFLEIKDLIMSYKDISYHTYHFQDNFADLKNYTNSFANNEFIFNLDADEDLSKDTLEAIRQTIKQNPSYDLFFIPRINTVEDLTKEDISKWQWQVNDQGWINWPDYQPRVYKNHPNIRWSGQIHEQITGNQKTGVLPAHPNIAIVHAKKIEKQRSQNAFYDQITKEKKAPISIKEYRTLVGLCSWQNPELLKHCVDSLLASLDMSIDNIAVVLNEGDMESIEYLRDLKIPFVYNPENSGPLAIDFLKGYMERSEYFLNSNDDMIFHDGFMEDLISIVDTYYPATASCGLVENFFSNNPMVVVDKKLHSFDTNSIKLFLDKQKENEYIRSNLIYGYTHPILCKSKDLLEVGGYSGNWDINFLSGYGRDDMFPYLLWKKSDETYKFIVSDKSVVFHLSSFTNNKLPLSYRRKNHNQDKFSQLTGMSLSEFRNKITKIGQTAL